VLGKDPKEVSEAERKSAKPVSFGRPGGMGVRGPRQVARSGYGTDLDDEQVQQRIEAYHNLCPELTFFLRDEVDSGDVIADEVQLTPARYAEATGTYHDPFHPEANTPARWLGRMLPRCCATRRPGPPAGPAAPTPLTKLTSSGTRPSDSRSNWS
jgi:hypothetical protein